MKKETFEIEKEINKIIGFLPNSKFKSENYIVKKDYMSEKLIEISELVDELTFKGYKELSKNLKELLMIQKSDSFKKYHSILQLIEEAKKKLTFRLKEDYIFNSKNTLSYSEFKDTYKNFLDKNSEYKINNFPLSYVYYRRKKLKTELPNSFIDKNNSVDLISNNSESKNISIDMEVIKNPKNLDVTKYFAKSLEVLKKNDPYKTPLISTVKMLSLESIREDGYSGIMLNDKDIESFIKENWKTEFEESTLIQNSYTNLTNLEDIDDELTKLMVQRMRSLGVGFYGLGIFNEITDSKKFDYRIIKDYIKKIDFSKYVNNYRKFENSKMFSIGVDQPSKWFKKFYKTKDELIQLLTEEFGFDYYQAYGFVHQDEWPESLSLIENKKVIGTKHDFNEEVTESISTKEETGFQENKENILFDTQSSIDLSNIESFVKEAINSSDSFSTVSTLIPIIQENLKKDGTSIAYSKLEEQIETIIANQYKNHMFKFGNNIFVWDKFDDGYNVEKIFIEVHDKFFSDQQEVTFNEILETLGDEWILDADITKKFKSELIFSTDKFKNISINKQNKTISF